MNKLEEKLKNRPKEYTKIVRQTRQKVNRDKMTKNKKKLRNEKKKEEKKKTRKLNYLTT